MTTFTLSTYALSWATTAGVILPTDSQDCASPVTLTTRMLRVALPATMVVLLDLLPGTGVVTNR